MDTNNYDFGGWATRNDLRCSDGRIIRRDAFKHCSGETVPLVWSHKHDDPMLVLGNAYLENRPQGVYAYCSFNDTPNGQNAKSLVEHGDITRLSIHANQLRQNGSDVLHGTIREVSLVLAGANPGAFIDDVIKHSDDCDGEADIFTGELIELNHSYTEINHKEDNDMANSDERTLKEVFDTMDEDQQNCALAMVALALQSAGSDDDDDDEAEHAYYEEEDEAMYHNVFDNETGYNDGAISHDELTAAMEDAKRFGSMKEAFLEHGIADITELFPEAKSLNTPPEFISRDMDWVSGVMDSVHKTPFSRIKSMFANITEDEARALGYLPDRTHRDEKGNLVDAEGNPAYKKEEVFTLLKRTTTPATIYKKQKLDRDDVIDITDFDVVAWIKREMRMMLNEEIARAILIGDGRLSSSDDKINESNIRPISTDAALYTIQAKVTKGANADETAKAIIKAAVKARKKYKGSGEPTFYTTEDALTDMLLLEDGIGHRLYKTAGELASAMRVSKIVTVPVMENVKGEAGRDLIGVIVNLKDYNVGADKGGQVAMFDDFDIDYNQQKYLMETRCSGALIKPYSAIALTFEA